MAVRAKKLVRKFQRPGVAYIGAHIPLHLQGQLERLKTKQGTTFSWVITQALERFLAELPEGNHAKP